MLPSSESSVPLLRSGHRPFFLLAVLWAGLAMGLWLLALAGHVELDARWHGHEMVFGFSAAAIAGFLMAAVPKWTGRPAILGPRLLLLILLWSAGRAVMLWGQATWIDLFFLPCLAILIARDILASGNRRNLVMPFILIALAALNLLLWLDLPALPAEVILPAAITLIAALVALIGGRIIPAFTQNGLRQQGITANCVTPRWLDRLVIPALLAAALLRLILPASIWEGGASGLVALLLAARLVGWHSFQTRKTPLLWNLHVGYSFLPLGFALTAIADFGGPITASAALHALTVGAMGVMIAAVASRAGLGHAGRPLIPSPLTIGAYVLLITAALVRVFWPEMTGFYLAGGLWIAGWGLLAVVYGPILTQKRIDGLPG